MLSLLLNYKLDSVSGLVPTYGRELFMPQLLRIWLTQNYDLLNRELIIIDDSDNFYANQIKWNKLPGLITFYYSSKKLDLGYKRNLLNRMSNGEWLACYDDDDYYLENRLNYCLSELKKNNKLIGGSSQLYMYSPIDELIYQSKFHGSNHSTNATLMYHKTILESTSYNNSDKYAEEKYFLKDYTLDIYQFDSLQIIIVIAHLLNTIDKYKIIKNFTRTNLTSEIILSDEVRKFYKYILKRQID
jgi:hypothetical protein